MNGSVDVNYKQDKYSETNDSMPLERGLTTDAHIS